MLISMIAASLASLHQAWIISCCELPVIPFNASKLLLSMGGNSYFLPDPDVETSVSALRVPLGPSPRGKDKCLLESVVTAFSECLVGFDNGIF
ncbi:hypothetical protein BJ741DRAFT_611915, partial [Chytriomyces cf. hyalinus JEL632]